MTANYQIMTKQNEEGKYMPNYDELIKNASCEEEAKKWMKAKEMQHTFAFNMVVCMQQKCGHWEIFQHPINEYYTIEETIKNLYEESSKRKCTRCICHW